MSAADKLTELIEKADSLPWWKWPDMPYLFSGDKSKKNAYIYAWRAARIDYGEDNGELITYLVNNASAIRDLIVAAENVEAYLGANKRRMPALSEAIAKLKEPT